MIGCPKCGRQVQPKRTCIYCGTVLSSAPTTVGGLDASGWVGEGARFIQQNQLDRAVSCFTKALTVDANSAAAWAGKARAHATRGERDEAIKCLDNALTIDPNDGQNKALRARLMQMPQGLPPGRQSTGSIASSFALESRDYATRAAMQLYGELAMVASPAEIIARNWSCAVPPHVGWPGALREVLAHAYTKDGRAFAFYYTVGVKSVPNERISDEELAGWGALLQGGRANSVYLCSNVVWSPPVRARIDAVNDRLVRLGATGGGRIELLVVSDN